LASTLQGVGRGNAGLDRAAPRRWTSGTVDYGAPVVSGGRVYASGTTLVGGEPVTYVDQFALR
jgi:hypothetical protein